MNIFISHFNSRANLPQTLINRFIKHQPMIICRTGKMIYRVITLRDKALSSLCIMCVIALVSYHIPMIFHFGTTLQAVEKCPIARFLTYYILKSITTNFFHNINSIKYIIKENNNNSSTFTNNF